MMDDELSAFEEWWASVHDEAGFSPTASSYEARLAFRAGIEWAESRGLR